jgi:hypothetical protein
MASRQAHPAVIKASRTAQPGGRRLGRDGGGGVSGQQLLGDLAKDVLGRGGSRDQREGPDDIEAVTWPLLGYDGSRDGRQRRGERRDVPVLPANQHDAGAGAHDAGGQLGFLALGEVGRYLKTEAATETLNRLVCPVRRCLARVAVGRHSKAAGTCSPA